MGGVLDRARATSLIGRSLIREDAGELMVLRAAMAPTSLCVTRETLPAQAKVICACISWATLILGVIYSVTGLYGAMERLLRARALPVARWCLVHRLE